MTVHQMSDNSRRLLNLDGGVKKSSGVNVLPIVAETWAQVRDDSNKNVDWLIASFNANSKTDVTIMTSGCGGVEACSNALPDDKCCYGGIRLENGRFVTFYYAPDNCPPMQRGRASMYKNGVLNVLEGSDREINMEPGIAEKDI